MSRTLFKAAPYLFALSFVILSFQNCSAGFESSRGTSSSLGTDPAQELGEDVDPAPPEDLDLPGEVVVNPTPTPTPAPPPMEGLAAPDFGLDETVYGNLRKVTVGQASGTDYKTISAAVANVSPGTVVVVEDGTYREAVTISVGVNARLKDLSSARPLILVARNPHRAILMAPTQSNGFYLLVSYVQVHNFSILSGTPGVDTAPIKVIGAGGTLEEFANRRRHIVIAGNKIDTYESQRGQDILKIASVDQIRVLGNLFAGKFREDGVDHVSVTNSKVMYNTYIGEAMNGFSCKSGTQDVIFSHNDLAFTNSRSKGDSGWKDSTRIGGIGFSHVDRARPEEIRKTEATRVIFERNVIRSKTQFALIITGAESNVIRQNYFAPQGTIMGGLTPPEAILNSAHSPSGRYLNDPITIPGWTLPGRPDSEAVGHRDSGKNLIENNIYDGSVKTFHRGGQSVRLINGLSIDQRAGNVERNNRPGTMADVDWSFGVSAYDKSYIYKLLKL